MAHTSKIEASQTHLAASTDKLAASNVRGQPVASPTWARKVLGNKLACWAAKSLGWRKQEVSKEFKAVGRRALRASMKRSVTKKRRMTSEP